MKYFLSWNERTNKMMIDTRVRKGWKTQERTEADSWLEAKQNFGFELSPLQKGHPRCENDSIEISRRIIRHQQNARTELWPTDSELFNRFEALEDSGECV